jgi:hypothetical protein
MKLYGIIILLFFTYTINAQTVIQDTVKPRPSYIQFLQIIDGSFSDTLVQHVWLIGNPDCHRCDDVKAKLKEFQIPYTEFDVRDNELLGITYELVRKYEKSEKLAFSFPIVVVNKRVFYNFPDIAVMVEEIKKITAN